ncbi:MAG TPA: histidine phosphatase family protein [Roseiarcus sp.]|jgi:broad specificity phosphatase PhoE|nr:histidine phosphatase family protein [Roseiarcus sp.]
MTTHLKLICHASTSAVRAAAFPADESLDGQGRQKLAAAALRVRADRCWTSPALRACQTADALRLDATVEPMLRDCDYGRWTGRTLDEVQAQEPEAVAEWLGNPRAAPHGGESVLGLMERVAAWLDAQKGTPGVAVAVTHASVIRAAVVHALEAEARSFWRIDVAPLSLTRLSGANGRWKLVSLAAMTADLREP